MTDKQPITPNTTPHLVPPREQASKRRQREVIGQELRRMFDDVAAEPVPDDFMALLEELERKETGQ